MRPYVAKAPTSWCLCYIRPENYGADPSDEDFVEALYDNALDRQADDAGADFWEDALADGLSREAALVAFAMSIENVTNNAGNIEDGFWVG